MMTTPFPGTRRPARRRRNRWSRRLGLALALGLTVAAASASPAGADEAEPSNGVPDLGANITVFDPSMPVGEIQAILDATHAAQVDN